MYASAAHKIAPESSRLQASIYFGCITGRLDPNFRHIVTGLLVAASIEARFNKERI